jgi:hypothetical protein
LPQTPSPAGPSARYKEPGLPELLGLAQLPVPTISADRVRDVTGEVLSRAEFQPAQPTWLDRALLVFYEMIGRFLDLLGGTRQGSVIGTLVVVVFVAVAALLVARFARTVRRDPSRGLEVTGPVGRTAADWVADADAAAASGDYREALRCRYRALLADLAAAGLVEEVPGRTTGEYLHAVGKDIPAATDAFEQATRRFEVAWYGPGETGPRQLDAFVSSAGETLAAAGIRGMAGARS